MITLIKFNVSALKIENPRVGGSIPSLGTINFSYKINNLPKVAITTNHHPILLA